MQTKSTKRTAKRKEPTAHAQAVAVLEFINSAKVPDFLSVAVIEAIDRACEHLDPHRPFKPLYEPGYEQHNMDVLQALFKRTRMLSLEDIEKSEAGLARHIIAIANHPKVPNYLYNKVGDFVTNGTMIKNAEGETLLDRWAYAPETVTAIVKWANEYEDIKESVTEVGL